MNHYHHHHHNQQQPETQQPVLQPSFMQGGRTMKKRSRKCLQKHRYTISCRKSKSKPYCKYGRKRKTQNKRFRR